MSQVYHNSSVNSKHNQVNLNTDQYSYGICDCGQPFRIPGLERSLCGICGWVKTPGYNSFILNTDPPPPPKRKSSKVKQGQSTLFEEVQP